MAYNEQTLAQYFKKLNTYLNELYQRTTRPIVNLVFPNPGGLELALAYSGASNSERKSRNVEPLREHLYFAKHGGTLHHGGNHVHVPKSHKDGRPAIIDLSRKPDGVTAKQYVMQVTGLNDKQARKFMKLRQKKS